MQPEGLFELDIDAFLMSKPDCKFDKSRSFKIPKISEKKIEIRNESPQGRPQGRCRPIFVELVPLERLKKSRELKRLEAAKYYKSPSFKNGHEV